MFWILLMLLIFCNFFRLGYVVRVKLFMGSLSHRLPAIHKSQKLDLAGCFSYWVTADEEVLKRYLKLIQSRFVIIIIIVLKNSL